MKGSTNQHQFCRKSGFCKIAAFIVGMSILVFIESVFAVCIDISDTPMETKVQAAPANLMFVLDNSGSMDWEFMTSETNGIFSGEYYIYPDSAFINGQDRVYGSSYILGSDEQRDWKSQWAGYNKVFYNPNAQYSPWPKKTDADTSEPWSNPNNTTSSSSKFQMTGEYYSITPGSGSTVSVKNAHYFMINDLDEDGAKDSGEDIYLVNFVNGIRAYYLVDDTDGDNRVDSGELYLKTGTAVPDGVKAKIYDEDGTLAEYATDAQDLQNFANWFSFYRKRELTAKAAVAGAIHELDWVYVGFYSINSGLRQAVLPIGVETTTATGEIQIIVDNKDSGYSENSSWYESSASSEYDGSSRYTGTTGGYATFTPNIPSDDQYTVYVWYTKAGTRDTNAKYTIHHAGGDATFRINQQSGYGDWVELGQYSFDEGSQGYVRVTRDGSSTGNSTSADAVKFVGTASGSTTSILDDSDTLLSNLYDMDSSGGTPLRTALNNVGRYFHMDDGNSGNLGDSPFADADEGGACQQAFAIVITDGFWNGSSPGVGNQDADTSNLFDGAPYADNYDDTLADVAMKYFKNDLAGSLDDVVPTNSCDQATHQHMVTYGVSFGVEGTLTPSDYDSCLLDNSTPVWPNPTSGDQQKIDDLYHATINGRGLFFSAANPQELVQSLVDVTSNIASRISSGASVSVNGEELNSGTTLYQASYLSDSWTGDVTAYPVNPVTGEIQKEEADILWHASDELQNLLASDRNIVSYDPVTGMGIDFLYSELNADQQTQLNPDAAEAQKVVSYIRGEEISGFRSRTKKLADIIHSAPLLMGETVYVGGNDGMLHAFNSNTGQERFAYIPDLVMHNYYNDSDPEKSFFASGYEHRFFVDLTPSAKEGIDLEQDSADTLYTLLVGGLGKGGHGYYCLDITNADSRSSATIVTDIIPMVQWEYPKDSTPQDEIDDLGYSFSMPIIVKSNIVSSESSSSHSKYKWVVIFGNGYDSTNGSSVLYILGLDGQLIKKIDTGALGCNGLSTPSVIDVDNDLRADYVYAGDLNGNLWKFDLTSSNSSQWEVAYKESASVPAPFFSVPGKSITSKPDVMRHCDYNQTNTNLTCSEDDVPGYMVMFGTGKYLNEADRISTADEYIFGLWDYGDDADDSEYLGTFNETGTPQLSNLNSKITLLEQTEESASGYYNGVYLRILTDNSPSWEIKCDATSTQNPDPDPDSSEPANAGWFFQLSGGERVIKDVIIRDNNLIYLTFKPDVSPCSGGGNSIIHEVDACSGGRLSTAQFDINNDRQIDEDDLIEIEVVIDGVTSKQKVAATGKLTTGLLHIPVFLKFDDAPVEMKIFSTSSAGTETLYETAEPTGLFYWRTP